MVDIFKLSEEDFAALEKQVKERKKQKVGAGDPAIVDLLKRIREVAASRKTTAKNVLTVLQNAAGPATGKGTRAPSKRVLLQRKLKAAGIKYEKSTKTADLEKMVTDNNL